MKSMTRKFLAAGLLASALTFVGCKSDTSGERKDDAMQTPPADTTEGTSTTPAEGTDTQPAPDSGSGGSGTENISKTKPTDDNPFHPREDNIRTPENESIEDAEREGELGVHDNAPGIGGSGFDDKDTNDPLNVGGNVDDTDDTDDITTPRDNMRKETQIPEGTR